MSEHHRVTLSVLDDYDGWRDAARNLAEAGVPPSEVVWQVAETESELFGLDLQCAVAPSFPVPRAFVQLAKNVICHSDPQRFSLLYALLVRAKANRRALEDEADPLVRHLQGLSDAVRRDMHKMHAFVRFREIDGRFVAVFEPEHHIVRRSSSFFVNRFTNMCWSILTPELSIHWDGLALSEGPGATRADAPAGDPLEGIWRTYYASIFNPARLKIGAMLKEMPKKYWRDMPETSLVKPLIAGSRKRELDMIERAGLGRGVEDIAEHEIGLRNAVRSSWDQLFNEARKCTRCDLHKHATQTVFGEGPTDASIMFVGEQPGDQEDVAGRPFVGPAGQVFDAALENAGIDRSTVYVTNAVKHFKFVHRGKRRIHSKPNAGEIEACRWWIENERALVRPSLTVALGATAARSLLALTAPISRIRGTPLKLEDGGECWVTVHPSFLLRIPEQERQHEEHALFVRDLKRIKTRAEELAIGDFNGLRSP